MEALGGTLLVIIIIIILFAPESLPTQRLARLDRKVSTLTHVHLLARC